MHQDEQKSLLFCRPLSVMIVLDRRTGITRYRELPCGTGTRTAIIPLILHRKTLRRQRSVSKDDDDGTVLTNRYLLHGSLQHILSIHRGFQPAAILIFTTDSRLGCAEPVQDPEIFVAESKLQPWPFGG